ncbi:MAG: hypothetical protein IIC94_01345, partial [Chloroflexi bacterium]|nr:hypothetical protein [Chloroflexota bacterium]
MNQHPQKPFEVARTDEPDYYPMLEKLVDVVTEAAERLSALAADYEPALAVRATVVQGQLMLMERPESPTPRVLLERLGLAAGEAIEQLESELTVRESTLDAQDGIQKRIIADLRQRIGAYRTELEAAKKLLL